MPTYQELDPEICRKMIEGYDDVLEGEAKKQDAFYRQFRCLRCGSACEKIFLGLHHAFDPGSDTPLPRSGLRCTQCSCTFDPHSGLIVEIGEGGKDIDVTKSKGDSSSG